MIDAFLVPEKTVVSAKGDGAAVDIGAAQSRVFLLVLTITCVIEQESLDVSVLTSADGATWDEKPAAKFPQKFYRGEQPQLLDLSSQPQVTFLRAHWDVGRWGRGSETPMFEFHVRCREVPASMLAEMRSSMGTAKPA
jgi:hypothetical protein